MAYDPNDPKDVELVEGMIADATKRLQDKNSELIGEIRDLRKGKGDPEKMEKLERQLDENQKALDDANRALSKAQGDVKKLSERAEGSEKRVNTLLTDTALAKAMVENKIAPHFHDAVQAMFGPKATVKVDNGVENVLIGDKSVSDALKEFAGSDVGKHYVAAGNNGGGGSQGGGADRGANTMTREAFGALPPNEQMAFSKSGGTLTES
jgi:TolA-binding protein